MSVFRGLVILVLCSTAVAVTAQSRQTVQAFPASSARDGMTLTLWVQAKVRADAAEFFVAFENTGSETRLLNLGLDRWNQQWPNAITFLVSRDGGPIEKWQVQDGRVAGRMDPLLVWLQKEERFSLRLVNEDFLGRETIRRPQFALGRYRVVAQFEGKMPTHVNPGPDQKRKLSWPYWHGTLVSEPVDFEIVSYPSPDDGPAPSGAGR